MNNYPNDYGLEHYLRLANQKRWQEWLFSSAQKLASKPEHDSAAADLLIKSAGGRA